jgi:CRISPR/Cas system-associated protein Csm6
METKYFRIQPRVPRSTFDAFKHIATSEDTDMSKLARRLIEDYIKSKCDQKTSA